jgi:hypothetical protein
MDILMPWMGSSIGRWTYSGPGYGSEFEIQNTAAFFMEIIILISWSIWTTRNDFIFKRINPNLYRYRRKFKEELA